MIPRAIGMAIAGALLTWGLLSDKPIQREMWDKDGNKVVVEESQTNLVGEAITVLLVAGFSMFIEHKKNNETKKTQELIDDLTPEHYEEVKKDGLAGPKTREAIKVATEDVAPEPTIPGGDDNPKAADRRKSRKRNEGLRS
jgi:hypothetical protein